MRRHRAPCGAEGPGARRRRLRARRSPGHRLALAGAETDPGYRAAVERAARALGVADRVHFFGNVRPGDVPDLLARSSPVLVPSTHETFSRQRNLSELKNFQPVRRSRGARDHQPPLHRAS
ncbi:glycosyltransferase [Sorangium sp. So ce1036]|uniref:glycosyltransferase n=1 Tax=Sorangium sp. So ce1036 TaxID=3133328 RepID=UPI003F528873